VRTTLLAVIVVVATTGLVRAQHLGQTLPAGPQLLPPATVVQPPAHVQPGLQPAASAPPFRWGWFGAQRQQSRAQWHYDYQGSAIRWKYYR
jgi:hypothetical protein